MPATKNPKQRHAPQTTRRESVERPHPSRGGTRGYDMVTRQMAMSIRENGLEGSDAIVSLQQQGLHPAPRSTRRWAKKRDDDGDMHPYEMNGNAAATVLKGNSLLMLSLFRILYPKATAAEVNAFLFNSTLPGQPLRFFSESQITEAEHFLGFSRKRASTTAYQALYPSILPRRQSFWNEPYPYGIAGTSRSRIIDWDEAGVFIETTNRGYGKCYISRRAKEEGPYNHSEKYTLTAAIRGGAGGGCWIDVSLRAGTGVIDTYDFLQTIVNQIGVGGAGNTHTFICDNLSAHHNPLIHLLINNNQHRLVFVPPTIRVMVPLNTFQSHPAAAYQ